MFENYGDNKTLQAYVSQPNTSALELSNSINLGQKYYVYYFDLGVVNRTPVYSSIAYEYSYDYEAKLTFDKLTSETLTSATTVVNECIDTHSYTGGFNVGFEQSVDLEAGFFKVVNLSASFTTNESTDHHWTNNWGRTITNSEETSESYINSYSEGHELKISFSEANGFKKGYSYRVTFYESVKVYGVLIYDVKSQEYSVVYQNFFEPMQKKLVIEESKDGFFNYISNNTLTFDVDEAIRIANNNIPEYVEKAYTEPIYEDVVMFSNPSGTLIFNFSKYQAVGNLNEFHYTFFKDGVLTINPAINSKEIKTVEFIG